VAHRGSDIVSHWGPLSWPLSGSQTLREDHGRVPIKLQTTPLCLEHHFHLGQLVCRALLLSRNLPFLSYRGRPDFRWLPCVINRSPTAIPTNPSLTWIFSCPNLQSFQMLTWCSVPCDLRFLASKLSHSTWPTPDEEVQRSSAPWWRPTGWIASTATNSAAGNAAMWS
jgi:hypothetical protein